MSATEPPDAIAYTLDEALTLLAALEDARDGLVIWAPGGRRLSRE